MKNQLFVMSILMTISISFFSLDNVAFGHATSTLQFSPPIRIEDETFSSHETTTDGGFFVITGKLASLRDYEQTAKLSIQVTTDQIQRNPISKIINDLFYGINKDYPEHKWYFDVKTNYSEDTVVLQPNEIKDYKITAYPLKAGNYHVHTFLTLDERKDISPYVGEVFP